MRVLVAGASGVIGRRLVPMLVAAGHEVVGTTRRPGADTPRWDGVELMPMDGLDADSVLRAVELAAPDAIVHQLSALKGAGNLKKFDQEFAVTNQLRTLGTDHLLAAAKQHGVKRFVAQSYTGWPNARTGGRVKTELDPLDPTPTGPSRETLAAIRYVEEAVPRADHLDGLVLRYGAFYGPRTSFDRDGDLTALVRQRRLPVVGGGSGVWSFVHIDDAASATVAALERGAPGVYNVVDDDPADVRVWLPALAELLGAKPPRKVPAWLARPMIGEHGVAMMTQSRGSSNAKARVELDWHPTYSSWREGMATTLRG
jgi:nucleoside-diphosphate-sugar epimerase